MTDQTAVQVIQPHEVREMSVDEAVQRFAKIEELSRRILHQGIKDGTGDFGVFPGTIQKVLFKAGAEKLCTVFRLGAHYSIEVHERDPESDHVTYTVRCTLRNQGNGVDVGSALGLCSSKESKYRYRNAGRVCPECKATAIIKGSEKYGGGWACWKKQGGCGAKFKDGDQSIESQDVGKIENPDIADVENTVLKMAEKRAHVAATLNALGISSLFTQDIVQEEDEGGASSKRPKPDRPAPASAQEAPQSGKEAAPGHEAQGSPGLSEAAFSDAMKSLADAGEKSALDLAAYWRASDVAALRKRMSPEQVDKFNVSKEEWKGYWRDKGE